MRLPLVRSSTCDSSVCGLPDHDQHISVQPEVVLSLLLQYREKTDSQTTVYRIDAPQKPKTFSQPVQGVSHHFSKLVSRVGNSIIKHDPNASWFRYDFVAPLLLTLEEEPLEDGYDHPAEKILASALRLQYENVVIWFRSLLSQRTSPTVVASVLKCIGRVEEENRPGWGYDLAEEALRNESAEIRDAAVQLLEAWKGKAALAILKNHKESEPWLEEYIQGVLLDLRQ
jgi:hypothetical protein